MTDPRAYEIETSGGRYLDLADPDPVAIALEDVARGLARTCRFSGQARRFYSVAEHAVLVADRLAVLGAPVPVQLAGLHHDDAEAFVGDVTRPLKALLPGYAAVEARVLAAVLRALDVRPPFDDRRVKEADDWALSCEAWYLLPSRGRGWFCEGYYDPAAPLPPALRGVVCLGLEPHQAEGRWLRRHADLLVAGAT